MSEQQRAWHFVLVLQIPTGSGGHTLSESSGTIDLPSNMSRHDVFEQLRERMVGDSGARGTVLFWSLERNTLGTLGGER